MDTQPRVPLVYLAGKIADCTDDECNAWRDRATELLAERGVGVLNPMVRDLRGVALDLEMSQRLVLADKADISRSAAVVLRADAGPSWGTPMEAVFAHDVVRVAVFAFVGQTPVSPWLRAHALVVETLGEACRLAADHVLRAGLRARYARPASDSVPPPASVS